MAQQRARNSRKQTYICRTVVDVCKLFIVLDAEIKIFLDIKDF